MNFERYPPDDANDPDEFPPGPITVVQEPKARFERQVGGSPLPPK